MKWISGLKPWVENQVQTWKWKTWKWEAEFQVWTCKKILVYFNKSSVWAVDVSKSNPFLRIRTSQHQVQYSCRRRKVAWKETKLFRKWYPHPNVKIVSLMTIILVQYNHWIKNTSKIIWKHFLVNMFLFWYRF